MCKAKAFKRAIHYNLCRKYKTNICSPQLRVVYVLQQLTWQKPSPHTQIGGNSLSVMSFKSRHCLDSIGISFIFVQSCQGKSLWGAQNEYFNMPVSSSITHCSQPWAGVCHQKSRFWIQLLAAHSAQPSLQRVRANLIQGCRAGMFSVWVLGCASWWGQRQLLQHVVCVERDQPLLASSWEPACRKTPYTKQLLPGSFLHIVSHMLNDKKQDKIPMPKHKF